MDICGYLCEMSTDPKRKDLLIPSTKPIGCRVNITRASIAFELAALEHIKKQDYRSACEALMMGIQYDRAFLTKKRKNPDFRLYDLLAGLSVRHGLPDYLEKIIQEHSERNLPQASILRETIKDQRKRNLPHTSRLRKWTDRNSKWYKKWADKTNNVLWGTLPM